jgi:protein SCO1/2
MRGPALAVLLAALACGVESTETYEGTGVVRSVDRGNNQIEIAHDEIPGFMPAMTMSFDVASPEILAAVEPGMKVRFELERRATTLRITDLEVTGQGGSPVEGGLLDQPTPDLAPGFRLVDQAARPFALDDLRGQAVLLDFIFTRCPGPCPILTSSLVTLQRRLPANVAARTRFVSISLDPEYDTPERMRDYAEKRGVSFDNWSFLTGDPDEIQRILDAYHVGTVRKPDGSVDHVVVTFLIDPAGRIAARYLGLENPPEKILDDLREVLS